MKQIECACKDAGWNKAMEEELEALIKNETWEWMETRKLLR